MTEPVIHSPSEVPEHDPTKVRRSKDGRPYVKHPCPQSLRGTRLAWLGPDPDLCRDGRVAGKRKNTTKQCPTCKGKGFVEKLYARCTSFVAVLDDRSAIERWKLRTVLTGLGVDHGLLKMLDESDPDDRERLDQLAEKAFEVGDGHIKRQKGTDLHELTTYVDDGRELPETLTDWETEQVRPVTLQDRADLAAWVRVRHELELEVVGSEVFVVEDGYQIGGTYDRLVYVHSERLCPFCELPTVLDIKSGRVDYGAGKMAQQLAVYANAKNYTPETGERSEHAVCTHVGLIVHLAQGTGHAEVLTLDLVSGWQDVDLSSNVRKHRQRQRDYLAPLASWQETLPGMSEETLKR